MSRRARQQSRYHFRLAYPVFSPSCVRAAAASGGRGGVVAYNATRDREMARAIKRLMARYDESDPAESAQEVFNRLARGTDASCMYFPR